MRMKETKISFWRVALSALIFMVIAQVVHTVGAMLTMSYYTMDEYFPVWSKIMMPSAGPPPLSFMLYGLFYSLIGGVLFVIVYNIIKEALPWEGAVKKGIGYGLLVFALAGLPMALSLHLLINLPVALIVSWAVEMLVIYFANGMISAGINK
jgi:hypothetical protein